MANENILKGKWKQLKGEVQEKWGKLTDDEVERMEGNRTELVGHIQERYGKSIEEAEEEVNEWLEEMNDRLST
jgi:uncharacterized protein YjbJ (UPF0337 family)